MAEPRSSKTELDPSICGEDGPITPEQCALWLDAKYRRHDEMEDRAAAMWLRKLSARPADEPAAAPTCKCELPPVNPSGLCWECRRPRAPVETTAPCDHVGSVAWDPGDGKTHWRCPRCKAEGVDP